MTDTFDFLSCIKVVMVETTLPANIGSAARGMMTAGLSNLTLVNPKRPIDDTSYAHAKGGSPLLDTACVVQTLDEALADCQLIFAASSRSRHFPRPVVTPQMAAKLMTDFYDAQTTPPRIAILFGREAHGLSNEELATAHYHLQIPANPAYPVLNIANSIQVIASTLYAHHHASLEKPTPRHPLDIFPRQDWDEPAISHSDKTKLDTAVIGLLKQLSLANEETLAHLPNRLSRLSARLQLDKKEYALLMALIHKLQRELKE